jgi:hypothetical protein
MFLRNISPSSSGSKNKPNKKPVNGLLFNSEDGNVMFLQDVRLSVNYMVLQPRRPFFSQSSQ